jgi:hypothetical protein
LSKEKWFLFGGGWVLRNFSPNDSANMCDGGVERSNDFYSQLFKPKQLEDEGVSNDNN